MNAEAMMRSSRAQIGAARAAVTVLLSCWDDLCESEGFGSTLATTSETEARLDVTVVWPTGLRARASAAAASFASCVKDAFDLAVLGAASAEVGAVPALSAGDYEMPLCSDERQFLDLRALGVLGGLRPDQINTVRSLQPFALVESAGGRDLHIVGDAMAHLSEMLAPREHGHSRVAIWAHSSTPAFRSADPAARISIRRLADGVLDERLAVAEINYALGTNPDEVEANPMIAFDLIFNDLPLPRDPDDNLMARTSLLLTISEEFLRGMERSVEARRQPRRPYGSLESAAADAPWSEIDVTSSASGAEIGQALRGSDLGLGTYVDHHGQLTVLLQVGDAIYCRPIPAALPLDPSKESGTATEDASRQAAARWGLPDFVFTPAQARKGGASREIGDCTIVVGPRALAIQIKHRNPQVETDIAVEVGRLQKRIGKGAAQASGSMRSLSDRIIELTNARGRTIPVTGAELEWCRVVIVDDPNPPDIVISRDEHSPLPLVVLLRRDWDFLFDQLRSTSAVVDYLFRIGQDEAHKLGYEPARYFELAQADEKALEKGPAAWTQTLGVPTLSQPILPTAPASSMDEAGATVYRVILEDIASTPIDGPESDRMVVLAMLDRYPVAERAAIGRLLLTHLDDVTAPSDGVRWEFRRTILENGSLQLAFGACSSFNDILREAFNQWAMLRHHDFSQLQRVPAGQEHRTVAVLLTPRVDGARLWDTTSYTIIGDPGLTSEDLDQIRAIWDGTDAA